MTEAFTDADLKQLKDFLTRGRYPVACPEFEDKLEALLARLSAAEAYALTLAHSNDGLDIAVARHLWKQAKGNL